MRYFIPKTICLTSNELPSFVSKSFIMIQTHKHLLLFSFLLLFIGQKIALGQNNDCVNAVVVCTAQPLSDNNNGPGQQEIQGNTFIAGCLDFTVGEQQSAWYKIQINGDIAPDSELGFTIQPLAVGSDYDFAVYGPDVDCSFLGSPTRCSSADDGSSANGETGLNGTSTDVSEGSGPNSDGFVQFLIVQPGETYYILVNNFSADNSGFDLVWTGPSGGIDPNVILNCNDCELELTVSSNDQTPCQGTNLNLTSTITNGTGNYSYQWSASEPGFTFSNPNSPNSTVTPPANFSGEVSLIMSVVDNDFAGVCEVANQVRVAYQAAPDASLVTFDSPTCIGQETSVAYTGNYDANTMTLTWDWDGANNVAGTNNNPGPHMPIWNSIGTKTVTVTLEEAGCQDEFSFDIMVNSLLQTPTLSCDATPSNVTISWNLVVGAIGYNYQVGLSTNFPSESDFTNATSFTFPNVNPGDVVLFILEAVGSPDNSTCTSELIDIVCVVPNCEEPDDLGITNLELSYCTTANPFTLLGEPVGGAFSGQNINADGSFDPSVGAGNYDITYTVTDDNDCTFMVEETITIVAPPTADFDLSDNTACVGSDVMITYTGTAGNNATFDWDFGDGIVSPTGGQGPFTISWNTVGQKTIRLIITENGCVSASIQKFILVEDGLLPPDLNCTGTANTVLVQWNPVEGATDYDITYTINDDPTETNVNQADTAFAIGGLLPENEVFITVVANGTTNCGGASQDTITCSTSPCPAVPIAIVGLDEEYCLNDPEVIFTTNPPFQANDPNYIITGVGVSVEEVNGQSILTFNPSLAGAGDIPILYNYRNSVDNCEYEETFTVSITPVINTDFTITPENPCEGETVVVNYIGDPADNYNWTFGEDASPSTANSQGPFNVTWSSGGVKVISLQATRGACEIINPVAVTVDSQLEEVSVECIEVTEQSVTFTWQSVPNATGYEFEILIDDQPSGMGTLAVGANTTSYTVNNLSNNQKVTIEISPVSIGACETGNIVTFSCFSQDCPQQTITIDNLPTDFCGDDSAITLTGTPSGGIFEITDGTTTTVITEFDPITYTSGNYTVTYTYTENDCVYPISQNITLTAVPVADFDVVNDACVNELVSIEFIGTIGSGTVTYDWDFGTGATPATANIEGPHEVSWANSGGKQITLTITENGCESIETIGVIIIEPELVMPSVTCSVQGDVITFSWDDVGGTGTYFVTPSLNNVASPTETITSTTYSANNLTAGDEVTLSVVAEHATCNNSPAGENTCSLTPCPDEPTVTHNLATSYCQDAAPITLTATPPNGTFSIIDGNNTTIITDLVPSDYTAGVYTVLYDYVVGGCDFQEILTVELKATPVADFSTSIAEACENEFITISFTGVAPSNNTTYAWDFGEDAEPLTDNTVGPHQVRWTASGVKTISLQVVDGDCSNTITQSFMVNSLLVQPIVICESTTENSVTFSWNDVGGTGDYIVSVIINNTPLPTDNVSNTTYTVGSLSPGDNVVINVVAVGGICGNSSLAVASCTSQNCSDDDPTIDNLANSYCADEPSVVLSATPAGGIFTVDVTGAEITTFTPADYAGLSPTIFYSYTDDLGCNYTTSQLVQVTSDLSNTIDIQTEVCSNEIVMVGLNTPPIPTATYTWSFGIGATPFNLTGPGPHAITWSSAGIKNVTLSITEGDCIVDLAEQIAVSFPLSDDFNLSCIDNSLSDITFGWDAIPGVLNYELTISINGNPPTIQTTTDITHLVDNLSPNDEVALTITALGNNTCGNSQSNSTTCIAQDCTSTTITLTNLANEYCVNEPAFTIIPSEVGGVFSGNGIVGDTFDPSLVGTDTTTITYDYQLPNTTCMYSISQLVTINEVPIADFSMDSITCLTNPLAVAFTGSAETGAIYTWSFDDGNAVQDGIAESYTLTWETGGTKTITLTVDANGCTSTIAKNVMVNEISITNLNTISIVQGETVALQPTITSTTDSLQYDWIPNTQLSCFDCPTPTAQPNESTTYTLTVSDELGCEMSEEVTINVQPKAAILIPSAFSPNEDGINDFFQIRTAGLAIESVDLHVFNRWGQEVFVSSDLQVSWDGFFDKRPASVGVYVYWLSVTLADGETSMYKGNLTLIR